ncbi:MAG: PKD domain-containing protein [Crocinitomicaceae bacterium]
MIITKLLLTGLLISSTIKIQSNISVNQSIESSITYLQPEDIILNFSYTYAPAAAAFIFDNTSIVQEELVQNWTWDFGDNTQSNEKSPRHVYEKTGSYNVKLTLLLKNGESKVITKIIEYK